MASNELVIASAHRRANIPISVMNGRYRFAFREMGCAAIVTFEMTDQVVPELLRMRANASPDRTCCAMDGIRYSYADMDVCSEKLAAGLANLGVGPGERVATLSTNRPEMLELFYGVAKTGATQVPLNAYLKSQFLFHQLRQSRSGVLVTDAPGRDALAHIRSQLPELRTVVMLDEARGDEIPYEYVRDQEGGRPATRIGAGDTMSILYTSGTTGPPKGCVASHGYYVRGARLLGHALEIGPDDTLFAALPLYHAGARLVAVTLPLLFGIPGYLDSTFSARGYFPRAAEVGATVAVAMGPMGAAILAATPSSADRDHGVRRIMCAPLSVAAQQQFRSRFGVEPWVDIFGQTECMPTALTPLSSENRDPDGCGVAAADLEVALLDESGRELTGEATGEICIRPKEPHAMFDGYFEQPEATLRAFRGLWYHTGDVGRRLPSGAFAFVDRLKDSLRRRGENVSSMEVEGAIDQHPAVVESAVHAVDSELGEDDIKACIVARSTIDPEELFAFFTETLPYYAIPRYVEFVEALPRNAVGRVMKHKLREVGITASTLDFEAMNMTVTKQERR